MSLRSLDRRLLEALAAAVLLGAGAPAAAGAEPAPLPTVPIAGAGAPIADQIIVRHVGQLTPAGRADLRASAGVTLDQTLPMPGVEVVQTDGTAGARADALRALRAQPNVLWAEPNQVVYATTADPFYSREWGLDNTGQVYAYDASGNPEPAGTPDADVDAPQAWSLSRGAGVIVGVVDTGVQADHPDFVNEDQSSQLVAGTNYASDGHTTTADGNGHGTHVSGTIVAAENATGVVGVAPAAKVQPFRALGDGGSGSTASVAAAFSAAGDAGVRIVNASLGSTTSSRAESTAISSHPNTLYVVAAGNSNVDVDTTPEYPCSTPADNLMCVGASDSDDQPASFSNYGTTSVDLFAPGVDIASTWIGSSYAYASGTSMAAPMVSGVAALVASAHASWTPAQIKSAILNSVDYPPALSGRSVTGGRLNAARALGVDVGGNGGAPAPVSPTTPPPTTTPPVSAGTPGPQPTSSQPTTPQPAMAPPTTPQPESPPATTPASSAPATSPAVFVPANTGSSVSGTTNPATPASDGSHVGALTSGAAGDATLPVLPAASVLVPIHAGTRSAAAKAPLARLTQIHVRATRGIPDRVAFQLTAAGTITATIQRRRADGTRAPATHRSFRLPAGQNSVRVAGTGQTLGLGRGTWRVALRAGAGDVAILRIHLP